MCLTLVDPEWAPGTLVYAVVRAAKRQMKLVAILLMRPASAYEGTKNEKESVIYLDVPYEYVTMGSLDRSLLGSMG